MLCNITPRDTHRALKMPDSDLEVGMADKSLTYSASWEWQDKVKCQLGKVILHLEEPLASKM